MLRRGWLTEEGGSAPKWFGPVILGVGAIVILCVAYNLAWVSAWLSGLVEVLGLMQETDK